jgi:putative membrane protein
MSNDKRRSIEFWFLIAIIVAGAIFSILVTQDRVNWLLDAGWVVAGIPILIATRRNFPLTSVLYWLLALHALVLIAGGHWTYEKNPLGLWLQQVFQTQRNHYDRFGHFMQGFVPAILFREIYTRCSCVQGQAWLNYFAFISCLAFTAVFELIEWSATTIAGAEGDAFLGHQGDVWDAQWDMLWAMIGAALSLILLAALHQRQLNCFGSQRSG